MPLQGPFPVTRRLPLIRTGQLPWAQLKCPLPGEAFLVLPGCFRRAVDNPAILFTLSHDVSNPVPGARKILSKYLLA